MDGAQGTPKISRGRAFVVALAGGLGHALLMALALPGASIWALTLLAVFPLAWSAERCRGRAGMAALGVTLGVLPFWLYDSWFIKAITDAGFVPMCVYLSAYAGLFAWSVARLSGRWAWLPRAILVPVVWTGIEFLRGELVLSGYAWSLLGYPLVDSSIGQIAGPMLGVYFAGFVAAVLSGAAMDTLGRRRVPGVCGAAAVGACAILGLTGAASPTRQGPGVEFSVALVQTNVPQSNKLRWTLEREIEDWKRMAALLEDAGTPVGREMGSEYRPDLVMLPETMMPGPTLDAASLEEFRAAGAAFVVKSPANAEGDTLLPVTIFADELLALQAKLGVPMLIGDEGTEGLKVLRENGRIVGWEQEKRFNSVFLLENGRVSGPRYDKIQLTPFGEYMPLISRSKWLEKKLLDLGARGMRFDLAAGSNPRVFEVPAGAVGSRGGMRVVTPICFEVTESALCRDLVFGGGRRRADVIANVTNDGWFGDEGHSRSQHLLIARWRSLELGTPQVRAANTGISASIDERGRVLRVGVEGQGRASQVEGVLRAKVDAGGLGATVYARVGNIWGWLCLVATGIVWLVACRRGSAK